jgi:alkanesulfonate monooxygenase SsuD/methylene tetrahydromethanopterin reductase-like flavin-dependent oxidoreductase (luciferase family)
MEFGLLLGDVPTSVEPRTQLDSLLRQTAAAQEAGFTLLAIGQHFLYGDVRWLQPIPTIARLAAEVDDHVRFATTVLIAPLYDPVLLAEELATLDILTGGRLVVGLGLGYRREEYRQLGVPWSERVARFEETIALLRQLWTKHEVTFTGRFWQLSLARPHLAPVQQPTPPIWIGANAPAGVRRSARLGDAWPIGPRMTVAQIKPLLDMYRNERASAGLDCGSQPIRREVVLGRDEAHARERFTEMTAQRFAGYAAREIDSLPGTSPGHEASAAILGTPDSVRSQLTQLAESLPVGPVIVRAQWPDMSDANVESYLAQLGREVVRPLRSPTPTRTEEHR